MSIVLNERTWAENMIHNKTLGKKPFETLCRVAKYYIDRGNSKSETRKQLDTFLLWCDPTASIVNWSDTLDAAVKIACKYPLVIMDGVEISKPEMEIIDRVIGVQAQRLAFTLLCISKYWDAVSPSNDHWVNTLDTEVMQMANISTSIRRQSAMYSQLKDAGLIRFSKKIDNLSVRVLFSTPGDVELLVKDFRNLGYQYLKYHGEPYFACENCGLVVKINDPCHGRRQKYCKDCAVEVKMKQIVDSVMRRREGQRAY